MPPAMKDPETTTTPVEDSDNDDDVSVLTSDDESVDQTATKSSSRSKRSSRKRRGGKRRPVVVSNNPNDISDDDDDDSSIGSRSFGGASLDGVSVVSGASKEDLGLEADALIAQVEAYLADYDPAVHGPINENCPELLELQTALNEAKERLESSRQAAEDATKDRQEDIEGTKSKIDKLKRRNRERRESLDDNSVVSKDAHKARKAYVASDDEELDKSGHERDEMNKAFDKQKKRVLRKSKKRAETVEAEMRLGAKKALRRLRMKDVQARIAREEAEKKRLEQEKLKLDMSDAARLDRVHSFYMRFAMPKRAVFEKLILDLPKNQGVSVEDVALLPWDERGLRVNVSKLNKLKMGL